MKKIINHSKRYKINFLHTFIPTNESLRDLEMAGIYQIINKKTLSYYIGSTIDFYARLKQHSQGLRLNNHVNVYLQRAYNKYGIENFQFKILEKFTSNEENIEQKILNIEQLYLNEMKTSNIRCTYNISHEAQKPPLINWDSDKLLERVKNKLKINIPTYNQNDNLKIRAELEFNEKFDDSVSFLKIKNRIALIPAECFNKLKSYNYHLNDHKIPYIVRCGNLTTHDSLKQFYLANDVSGRREFLRFKNNNPYDCRLDNLESTYERKIRLNKTPSIYYNKKRNDYKLFISPISIGYFKSIEEASFIRDYFIKNNKFNKEHITEIKDFIKKKRKEEK